MAVTTFAAIDIGSYEVSMKIFEMSKRIGFREINDVRYQLELGRGTYAAGRLEMETVDELCEILNDFKLSHPAACKCTVKLKYLLNETPDTPKPVVHVPIQYRQYPFSQVEEEYRNLFDQLSAKICK